MDLRSRPLEDPARFGAMAAALFGAVGYAVCLLLSLLKLRTEHRCSSFIDSVCADRCAQTLHNGWSSLWGLPVTVYGAALYLVVFVLAYRASSGEPGRWIRVPLLALAWFTLAISAAYALYATLGLSILCEYCALLYATSIGLFLGAALLNGVRPLRAFKTPLGLRGRMTAALTVLGLGTSLAVHANLYWRLAAQEPGQDCKSRDMFGLPEPFLRTPADREDPPIVAAVFIDFTCPHCRLSVDFWQDFQAKRRDVLELRFYHFPADCIGGSDHQACDAARAFKCLSPPTTDQGFAVLKRLFALQDGAFPHFSVEKLRAVAREFGVEDGDFKTCRNATGVNDAVDIHLEFAERHQLRQRPAVLLIRMVNDQPTTAVPLQGPSKDEAFLDRNIKKLLHPNGPFTP